MLPAGFEPTISAGRQSQTHALDSAATGTGVSDLYLTIYIYNQFYIMERNVSSQIAGNIARVLKIKQLCP